MNKIGFEKNFHFSFSGEVGNRIFSCCDEIGNLWGLEKMLEIVDREFNDVFDVDFFEFGSAEFSLFTKIPMSGKVSHFMMFGTSLSYSCFDSKICESDFDLVCEVVCLHKKIMSGDFIEEEDFRLKECLDIYAKKYQKKDLPAPFVYEALAEEIPSLGIYYDLNLKELKKRIQDSSCKSYQDILKRISEKNNSVIFSLNVLNAPTLSFDDCFWKIENVFQIHGVNEVELLAKMGFSDYFENKLDRRGLKELGISVEEFVSKFKEMFLVDSDVKYEDGFFFWKS